MPQRRRVFADRINYREQAPPPRAQDPLCAIAPLLRVRPELQTVCRFAAQWDVPHDAEPAGWAQFHIVTTGSCLLERSGGHPLRLEAGDVLSASARRRACGALLSAHARGEIADQD
jgi:AraC family transcriptional regulator, activator of mtrCDE